MTRSSTRRQTATEEQSPQGSRLGEQQTVARVSGARRRLRGQVLGVLKGVLVVLQMKWASCKDYLA